MARLHQPFHKEGVRQSRSDAFPREPFGLAKDGGSSKIELSVQVHFELFEASYKAMARERWLKSGKGRKEVREIVADYLSRDENG
jgi:hypothetical protein